MSLTAVAGSAALAQVAKKCISTDLCYSLNIPESTTSTGDVYFQITAPTSYQWAAFGQGTQMKGANMYIIYGDSTGTNVTVSPRLGTGEVEPKYNLAANITLLDGSGISNGIMTANFRCMSFVPSLDIEANKLYRFVMRVLVGREHGFQQQHRQIHLRLQVRVST